MVSAGVLWLAVGWVSPANPSNTFGRAVLVSIVLSIAYYLTLAKFLSVPRRAVAALRRVWLVVVMGTYGIGFLRALLVSLVLALPVLARVGAARRADVPLASDVGHGTRP